MAVLITIPHCSAYVPPGIYSQMNTEVDGMRLDELLLDQSDLFSSKIYTNLTIDGVHDTVEGGVHRLVCDPNKARDSRGESGVVVTTDFERRELYPKGFSLSKNEIERRLKLYWDTFHEHLMGSLQNGEVKILLDCHTMKPYTPAKIPAAMEKRPDICIGSDGGKLCTEGMLNFIEKQLRDLFTNCEVKIDDPYRGRGYILQTYCDKEPSGIQVHGASIELNRNLCTDPGTQQPNNERIAEVKFRVGEIVERIANYGRV